MVCFSVKAIRAASTATSFESGMNAEQDMFKELMASSQAKALQYFFFAERKTSKIPDIPSNTSTLSVKSVG